MKNKKNGKNRFVIPVRDLVRHELIGLNVAVVESLNDKFIGFSGVLIDESRNMITLKSENGAVRKIPKEVCVFEFELPQGEKVRVDGRAITGRPQDRLKMKKRKVVWPLNVEKALAKLKRCKAGGEVVCCFDP
ncbi:MAG: ribonuclease P protein component 1 [Candidatus Freyarchaeota archaeon]|nr:ribonuclease P protein component 1 [Candidatus Freyrarchaeum guaymaensis]